jgi:hypothetical protein
LLRGAAGRIVWRSGTACCAGLTASSYVTVAGVGRMEAIAGLWKWPWRGEAESISSLRFMGLHFYPARLSPP